MIPPALPIDEKTRLAALHALKIVESVAEERFDRITRLARALFEVPVAMIGIVGERRVWFKSGQEPDVGEMARDVSFCGHAILNQDPMVVPDALLDVRFHDNPLVLGESKIRFYAGCALQAINGSKLGTLCLMGREPRTFDEQQRQHLMDLARIAERELASTQLPRIDPLTQLSNRRGFVAMAQHALKLCARFERHTLLLHFDLDGLDAIAERHGQPEVDGAVKSFAGLLPRSFRDSDVIARLGAHDFVVLMTDCQVAESGKALDRVREATQRHNRQARAGCELSYRVGSVPYEPLRHGSIKALLAEAEAMRRVQPRDCRAA